MGKKRPARNVVDGYAGRIQTHEDTDGHVWLDKRKTTRIREGREDGTVSVLSRGSEIAVHLCPILR
jgi:hypothetical protein